ncbi:hypothetical protein CBS101457_006267 [Exobasidium rhododendri]|nr:hypothetical protein CBS101457_006267 [Exobasidium rhododendri]
MTSPPSSVEQWSRKRQESEDHQRAGLNTTPLIRTSGNATSSAGGFGAVSSSAAGGSAFSAAVSTPAIALLSLDEASSTASHASSSRLGTPNVPQASTSREILYQPLSLADALSRANGETTRALDEVLAERNKLCLETKKLGTENVRIWNLVKRIKKENEELKGSPRPAVIAPTPRPSTGGSSISTSPSGMGQELDENAPSSLVINKETPSTSQFTDSQTRGYNEVPTLAVSSTTLPLFATPASFSTSAKPETIENSARSIEPAVNETRRGSVPTSPRSPRFATLPPTAQANRDLLQSPQQTSIMKQRAAAQAQRLAVLTSPRESGEGSAKNSLEGHEFEAIDYSSAANSEDDNSVPQSANVAGMARQSREENTLPAAQLLGNSFRSLNRATSPVNEKRQMSIDSLGLNLSSSSSSPRLDATMLNYLKVAVIGTNLRSNERSKDDFSFVISADLKAPPSSISRNNNGSWRVEKIFTDILALDARLKQKHGKNKVAIKGILRAPLPDRSLFKDHAPSKVDKRKSMLEAYLQNLLSISLPDKDDLCTFFCTDAVPIKLNDPEATTKEGFLTKKGANLGRWVTRLYCLSGSTLDYYEARGGPHLGSINVIGAQIGRQQRSETAPADKEMDENSYRHAFLILETKLPSAPGDQKQMVRHVLCAESDEERDDWVNVLVRAIAAIAAAAAASSAPVKGSTSATSNDESPSTGLFSPPRSFSTSSLGGVPTSPITPTMKKNGGRQERKGSISRRGGGSAGGNLFRDGLGSSGTMNNYTAPPAISPRLASITSLGLVDGPLPLMNPSSYSPYPTSTSNSISGPSGGVSTNNSISGPSGGVSKNNSVSGPSGIPSGLESTRAQPDYRRSSFDDQTITTSMKDSPSIGRQAASKQIQSNAAPPGSPLQSSATGGGQQQQSPYIRSRSITQEHGGMVNAANEANNSGPSQMTESASNTSSLATVPGRDRSHSRPAISGPMNGTPIPTGYKFGGGGGKEEGSTSNVADTKKRFWHRFGGASNSTDKSSQSKKVFGVSLAESIAVSNVSEGLELPSVVYRCIEYLEKKDAASEEGIYRLSGSSNVIKNLRERFDTQGDVDLLASSEPYYDPHAIAGLLKQFLRELTNSVLTRELHFDFMRVNEIGDRKERVNELGHLVSLLPLANYSLLRTLCSHLIKVIELSNVNKMTMRNVGIVFSPTLGIPGGVFALFLTEFDWIFFTDAKGEPAPKQMGEDIIAPDSAELGPRGPLPTLEEHGQDNEELPRRNLAEEGEGSKKEEAGEEEGEEDRQELQPGNRKFNNKHRKSWISGDAIHSGDGRVMMNLHQTNRDNRNSLGYNESEANKLLGGPQGRYRLSLHHEEMEAMMKATPSDPYDANDIFRQHGEPHVQTAPTNYSDHDNNSSNNTNNNNNNEQQYLLASPITSSPANLSQASPRKVHSQNNLTLNRNALVTDAGPFQNFATAGSTPTSPTSRLRVNRLNYHNNIDDYNNTAK